MLRMGTPSCVRRVPLGLGAARAAPQPRKVLPSRPLPRPIVRPSRGALRVVAHGGHGHSHDHVHGPGCQHDHSHAEEPHEHQCSGGGHSCGHGHDHNHHDPSNPVHRLLRRLYDALRLTQLAEWLEESTASTVGKIVGIVVAAGAAWLAGALAAQQAAAAALLTSISSWATWLVYALAGVPAMVDLSYDLTAGKVDTHVLMTLAALGTLVSGYAIEGALLLVLFQTSHTLEHLLTHKAQGNLQALYDTIPTQAVLLGKLGPGGAPDLASARVVRASEVAVGDHMLVKPGEQVPLDGVISYGRALVSSEHITGESLPVLRRPGDEVAAGSLNRDGLLVVKASRLAEESTPARIARLTLDAQATRPKLRTWLDEFGDKYSKVVVAASLATLGVLVAMGVPLLGSGAERGAFYRAMGFLTVASPCALVMVPLAYVSAIAAIASRGILVKGGRVLDALSGCRTVAFDKTGTLTTGSLTCASMAPLTSSSSGSGSGSGSNGSSGSNCSSGKAVQNGTAGVGSGSHSSRSRALEAAVALSQRSSHPVSDAVVLMGEQHCLDMGDLAVSDFRLVAGGGVEGTVSSSSGSSSSAEAGGACHCWFGSIEYVEPRLTGAELATVRQLIAAPGQTSTSVLSVLVMEPALGVGASASSSSNGSSSTPGHGGAEEQQQTQTQQQPLARSPGAAAAAAGQGEGEGEGLQRREVWLFRFEDSLRQQSAAAVEALQEGSWRGHGPSLSQAVQVTMLTGDNAASAERVARKLGITSVYAALSPEQKLARVAALQRDGRGGVIMVGDGINDAPALATADVGIAIASTATAAASAAADAIVLNASGIAAVPFLLHVAVDTQAIIRQNIALAAASIAALVIPTVLGVVPLWLAVFVHEGSTLLVALNSLRPLRHAARFAGGSAAAAAAGGEVRLPVAGGVKEEGGKSVDQVAAAAATA